MADSIESTDSDKSSDIMVQELAMLCRMMVQRLTKLDPHSPLATRVRGYLARHNLQGSPLRSASKEPT